MKKIVFLTGTRADYGKLKSLMQKVEGQSSFECHIFITGMHMLEKYGSTYREIEKDGFKNLFKALNQNENNTMDEIVSKTIQSFGDYVKILKPDMIVVHGDRLEALAGAIVGAFNNIRIAHIEGGEVSGTIDESIRHAISKFAHIHFVANEWARKRLIQLGEKSTSIFIIGSPDLDIMNSEKLPSLIKVRQRYDIEFEEYAILIYHPVTTEVENIRERIIEVVDAIIESKKNYIVIYPNNDLGSSFIIQEYSRFNKCNNIKVFPSIRFEYFLTLLKNASFMIGNSSSGIRETGIYGIPAIDIGNRQAGRYSAETLKNLQHVEENKNKIINCIQNISNYRVEIKHEFGKGNSDDEFIKIINDKKIWEFPLQKVFIDLD
ncbi:UDP-N-acetylglucosamine 2-epimerase [Clostridium beijerinckii]|uniref:UDP-N-acetylglucosamine 2-epimerase n=1 Tax=Clostridium beijerinckii TaxID=1520 RepID=UPI00080A2BE6|nr:UDP-N-acetylglucosamine 2-epimerase [Clostridium beijerinckii]OCA96801.1 UDP-N-acetyl-D-glucosamine 2-epimerase, UDP-hydrolysing [Clostridium beijerinckii]